MSKTVKHDKSYDKFWTADVFAGDQAPVGTTQNTDDELEQAFGQIMNRSGSPAQTKLVLERLGYLSYPHPLAKVNGATRTEEDRKVPSQNNGWLKSKGLL